MAEIKVNSKKAAARKPAAKKPEVEPEVDVKDVEDEPVVPKGYIVAEEGKYIAKKKCTFGIAFYRQGAFYFATKGEIIPQHFEKV